MLVMLPTGLSDAKTHAGKGTVFSGPNDGSYDPGKYTHGMDDVVRSR